ncbi:hypothetical protein MTR67_026176 [Solanum verrucosum]|uniref:Uncharacterized protein n=1 Tax=Solanum verrucosum TaxID=315347 RepID=A0AAF0R015_SOLVR|nr:hypothetical protein MTR67_026176 [Solanum verrucosum]
MFKKSVLRWIISRNSRSTRRFALWCSSSPSCTIFWHCCALGHWATLYCFTKLLGNVLTTLLFC